MRWIREAGLELPDDPEDEEIPEMTELDQLWVTEWDGSVKADSPYRGGMKRNSASWDAVFAQLSNSAMILRWRK